MATLTPSPLMQFIDANGNPLVGGKLYTYASGTTSPLATYTDAGALTPNTNPVIMNSRGEASVWLGTAKYSFTLKDADDVLIWTADGVAGLATSGDLQAFITLMSSSAGSANVGFIQAGSSAVATTGQGKMRERVSSVDFGVDLTGATTCTTTLQKAVDYSRSVGGTLWLNHGKYKMVGPVIVDYSTLTDIPAAQPYQVNISGEGAGNTVLISTLTTAYAMEITGPGTATIGSTQVTVIKDFSLSNVSGSGATFNGLRLYSIAGTKVENIGFYGLHIGLELTSVLTSQFQNLYYYYCNAGVVLTSGGFSQANALNWTSCHWGFCSEVAMGGGLVTQMNFTSCTIEGCGTQADSGTGGINLAFTGTQGEVGASFDGCYFEGNAGGWDVRIENTGTNPLTHTFKNCNFQRISAANFVTNNVMAYCSGGGHNILVFIGCSFTGYNDYAPDAGRLYVNLGTGTTAVYIGCTWSSSIEQGTAANLIPIAVKDEGSVLTTGPASIDFVGSGVTASNSGTAVTVTIPGTGTTNYSYTGTATGLTTSPTGTITYTKVGDIVTMNIPNISGTSNTTAFSITGGPATMRPSSARRIVVTLADASSAQFGTADVQPSGTIDFGLGAGDFLFTASGTKGIVGCQITYAVT